jgi:hypothetical protein
MVGKRWISIVALFSLGLSACGSETEPAPKEGEADATAVTGAVNSLEKGDSSLGPIWQGPLDFDTTASQTLDGSLPMHAWTVEAGEGSEAYIDLASRSGGDTFLLLYGRDADDQWALVDYDDDCASYTRNSCLDHTFDDAGEYLVVATSYAYMAWDGRPTMDYDLTVWCDDADGDCGPVDQEQACGVWNLPACPDGQYCDFPDDQCGAADRAGVCKPKPEACYEIYAPVCGCDGETYSNDCMAAAAGADVSTLCEPNTGQQEGEICGGIAGFQCADGLVCDYSANDGCYADAAGTCKQDTQILCTQEYDPVCGCDGVTYGNDCMRRGARVALDHVGEC